MNKDKLIQIIVKDLEELKTFTAEVAESQDNSTLIVDLALSRTQLIGKEFEILRQFLLQAENLNEKTEVDFTNDEEEEDSDSSFSDPELEIINFEEPESDLTEEEEEESIVYDSEEEELEEKDFDEADEESDDDDQTSEEETDVELEIDNQDETTDLDDEDEIDDLDDDFDDDEDEDELVAFEEKEAPKSAVKEEKTSPQPKTNVYMNELKFESQPGVREIHIEDMDDEEEEQVRFAPQSGTTQRPVMHEIPKPEFTAPEKVVVAETFQKDRSLNDTMAENKSEESSLGNGPITSLKASIGLNDRFLFIREIFANNTDKYNMVIDQLDKLESIQQAVEFLKAQLTLQKNETSLKFVELLKRRFSK